MQTSRFQLGLIAALAVGLGYTLSSTQAVGYPAGVAVSLGSNPIWNGGGEISSGEAHTLVTAPADQDVIVSDLLVQMDSSSDVSVWFTLALDDGTLLGKHKVGVYDYKGGPLRHAFASGLRVPAGRTLLFNNCDCGYGVNYIAAGYYVQP